jgi:predicted NAD/FAD-binding protein
MDLSSEPGLRIAVVGSGISGLSAAWLLNRRHRVTLYEQAARPGGHANTVAVEGPNGQIAVDTGFIVFNRETYPNLTALFEHLGVATYETEMSFSVSRRGGALEYGSTGLPAIFGQPANAIRVGFWSMLLDLRRFYATAAHDLESLSQNPETLGEYLARRDYGARFRDDHLLPMAAAIWSASTDTMLSYPAASFIRFFENHGLLKLHGQPAWHTVVGGSKVYVDKLAGPLTSGLRKNARVVEVTRHARAAMVRAADGSTEQFDHVVIATHADQALALLGDATDHERRLLGAFRYTRNRYVINTDPAFMPRRRAVWSSWNYIEPAGQPAAGAHVTYWMNRLQGFSAELPLFVTLNPVCPPQASRILHTEDYAHPVFDLAAIRAQQGLWSLQGKHNTWFCGAYFGAGFHEDGLQAGLAVAEDLGGEQRPWRVADDAGRIVRGARVRLADLTAAS